MGDSAEEADDVEVEEITGVDLVIAEDSQVEKLPTLSDLKIKDLPPTKAMHVAKKPSGAGKWIGLAVVLIGVIVSATILMNSGDETASPPVAKKVEVIPVPEPPVAIPDSQIVDDAGNTQVPVEAGALKPEGEKVEEPKPVEVKAKPEANPAAAPVVKTQPEPAPVVAPVVEPKPAPKPVAKPAPQVQEDKRLSQPPTSTAAASRRDSAARAS